MEELLQHAVAGTIVPDITVLEFEQVGKIIRDLQDQTITGRVVLKIP